MIDAGESMKAYYAQRAPYYDAVYDKPERKADIAFLRAHLAERLSGRHVLEIACGTGYWTQHIASRAASMTAVDALPAPLQIARCRPLCQAVNLVQADAYDLPEDLGYFDAAFAGLWWSHVPIDRRRSFLARMHRHLLPGSRVIFIDNSQVQCLELPITEHDEEGNTYQQRSLRDGSTHWVLKNFPTEADLRATISGMGSNPAYSLLQNFWLFEYQFD